MQPSSSSSAPDFQQLWGRWTAQFNQIQEHPMVALAMKTRVGQYLSVHPFLALTVMLFSAMAALPVGLFLTFALVTIIMSAVGFVFFEAFLLFVAGLTLLCVLSGIALFSVLVSVTFSALHITISNLLNLYYPHMTKRGQIQREDSETSGLKEM